jgi:hypothetical protein
MVHRSGVVSILLAAGAAASLLLGPAAARAEEPTPVSQHEGPDDPPGVVSRDLQPRTPASIIVRGNYRSIQVNVDAMGNNIVGDAANEPSIAIDPLDPQRMAIGWRQFDTIASNFRQAGYAYTTDGGEHWTFPGVLQPGQFRSDPVLDSDSNGVFYYYSLRSETNADLFVSTDGGATWSGPTDAFGGDKIWMKVNATGGAGDGQIFGLWNSSFTCCAAGTDFLRSTNGGVTFDGPYSMSSKIYWGTIDIASDQALYAVGVLGSGHAVVKSTDAYMPLVPPTFQTHTISLGGSTVYGGGPNPGGLAGQVWIAVDRSGGPTQGNLYVLGTVDHGSDPADVMFTRSVDGGVTWSAPVRVNSDPVGDGAWQWFGTMSVAPNGRIDVVWNDTRNDPAGILSEVNYAYSTDAGVTWSAGLPVTPAWNPLVGWPDQNKIGDYYDMVSDIGGASLAYSATFNGEQDVYFVRLGDCNLNGRHDSLDVALGTSADCNANQVPDECEDPPPCVQPDRDGDGTPDAEDCAPDDPTARTIPAEVSGVTFADDAVTISWISQASTAGTGTVYDVARGDVGQLPVVDDPTVICSAMGLPDPPFADPEEPGSGQGFYYLIRAANACVTAGWGLQSDYLPRLTFVCDPP